MDGLQSTKSSVRSSTKLKGEKDDEEGRQKEQLKSPYLTTPYPGHLPFSFLSKQAIVQCSLLYFFYVGSFRGYAHPSMCFEYAFAQLLKNRPTTCLIVSHRGSSLGVQCSVPLLFVRDTNEICILSIHPSLPHGPVIPSSKPSFFYPFFLLFALQSRPVPHFVNRFVGRVQ